MPRPTAALQIASSRALSTTRTAMKLCLPLILPRGIRARVRPRTTLAPASVAAIGHLFLATVPRHRSTPPHASWEPARRTGVSNLKVARVPLATSALPRAAPAHARRRFRARTSTAPQIRTAMLERPERVPVPRYGRGFLQCFCCWSLACWSDEGGSGYGRNAGVGEVARHREVHQGDVLYFVSHKRHWVQPVTARVRRVMGLELWHGPQCECAHRFLQRCGNCGHTG